jgi:hypothetical protein
MLYELRREEVITIVFALYMRTLVAASTCIRHRKLYLGRGAGIVQTRPDSAEERRRTRHEVFGESEI